MAWLFLIGAILFEVAGTLSLRMATHGKKIWIIGVAVGHLWGWKADIVVPAGDSFVNTVTRYDTFAPGPLVDESDLAPFGMKVTKMTADFNDREPTAQTFGQPRDFEAHVNVTEADGTTFTDIIAARRRRSRCESEPEPKA